MNKRQRLLFITLLVIGISIRVFAFIFYYIRSISSPINLNSLGDVYLNFNDVESVFTGEWIWSSEDLAYPPLSIYLLVILRVLAINNLYIFFFYCFLIEILVVTLFYFILKEFEIPHYKLIFGSLLINPFYYASFVFRGIISGYHVTDSLFCVFLIAALYFYPRKNKSFFYFFMAVSISVKWYTLPFFLLVFIKYIRETNWKELKQFIIYAGIPIFIFLVSPILYLPNYLDLYFDWLSGHELTANIPIYFKIIPFLILLLIGTYMTKRFDLLDITAFSFFIMVSIFWWSRLYVRYLAPLIYFGHLFIHEEIFSYNLKLFHKERKLVINNHHLTFIFSFVGVISLIFIALYEYSYFGLI
jgi:hypothetical protein